MCCILIFMPHLIQQFLEEPVDSYLFKLCHPTVSGELFWFSIVAVTINIVYDSTVFCVVMQ